MPTKMKNLYAVLGVDSKVDAIGLKRAYRRLAAELHPDRNGGDKKKAERFKEVAIAYALLSDPAKRAEYDRSEKPGIGGVPGARESIFGPMFDDLVARVQEEGVSGSNIDSLIADLIGVGHDVQTRIPRKAKQAVKSPSGILDLVEDILDTKIAFDKKRQGG